MNIVTFSLIVLGVIGVIAAVILFLAAKKFYVYEDPKIGEIEAVLPGANCGGCGYSGCHAFAAACAEAKSLDNLYCTAGGSEVMDIVAYITGLTAAPAVRKKAIVRCSASCDRRAHVNHYDGVTSCAIENSLYQGESDCVYGCLGCGDCVKACPFDALHIDNPGDMPRVDLEKCVACGKCVEACPRNVIALSDYSEDRPLVYVACMNHDKGPVAMKECSVACIGCGLCMKKCPEQAITVTRFLAEIDSAKCTGCLTCAEVCPRHIIASDKTESCASKATIVNI